MTKIVEQEWVCSKNDLQETAEGGNVRMDLREQALRLHRDNKGKLTIKTKVSLQNRQDLTLAYSPGVAEPCKEIHQNKDLAYEYTNKGNLVAIVTDGSAVLGLGDIGPEAALPVMEGKAVLLKEFANVDGLPICLDSQEADEIVRAVELMAPSFGAINLEDIAAPRCFAIEQRLRESLSIPVMHDDQHGTAIVVLAAVKNGLTVCGKSMAQSRVVINGAGAAGIAIAKLLQVAGCQDIILCDKQGILDPETQELNWAQVEIAKATNPRQVRGKLSDALQGADVFVGVSVGGIVTAEMVSKMNERSMVLALANPVPEIWPEDALQAGAMVVGTGRSDFPNQINNVMAFPGVFRGALDARASDINEQMKLAAADAIAAVAVEDGLTPEYIIPDAFDQRVVPRVAEAVANVARQMGLARA